MAKAKWSTKPAEIKASVSPDGTLAFSCPLYDGTTKVATVTFTITADRALEVLCSNEPGSAGLTGFQAWSTAKGA